MLSEKFKELLTIEEERLLAIRSDCAQFVAGDTPSAAVHQRVLDDVERLLTMTRNFRDTEAQTKDEKKAVLESYKEAAKTSMELSAYLFSNSHCAGSFRNSALQKHASLLNVIAREQVLTFVNSSWGLIEDILGPRREAAPKVDAPVRLAPGLKLVPPPSNDL